MQTARRFTVADIVALSQAFHGDNVVTRSTVRNFLADAVDAPGRPGDGPRGATTYPLHAVIAIAALAPYSAVIPALAPREARAHGPSALRSAWVATLANALLNVKPGPEGDLWFVLAPGAEPRGHRSSTARSLIQLREMPTTSVVIDLAFAKRVARDLFGLADEEA